MKSDQWMAWYGLLSVTQARDDGARSALQSFQPNSTWLYSRLARPTLALALPALLLGSGAGAVEASDLENFIPPGYGEPAKEGRTAANLAAAHEPSLDEPFGGHSLQLGPGAALSWSGVTLYDNGALPDDPTDSRPDIVLAPGFTPLLRSPVSEPIVFGGVGDHWQGQSIGGSASASGTRSRVTVGLSQSVGPFDLAVTGDYGRFKLPVRPELDLSEEEKLARVGAHIGFGGLEVRGSVGAEIKPFEIGNTLAWDLAATFDEGPWAFGLAYTHSLLADAPNSEEVDTLGTLQSGVRYSITPSMTAGAHAMFFTFTDEDTGSDTDLAGVLSFSMRF